MKAAIIGITISVLFVAAVIAFRVLILTAIF